ncbi:MAG: extracellular solute-binding protein [Clostridiales bacterium]|nr:extracellular solute-binding protein [Clostridiales bacterium]
MRGKIRRIVSVLLLAGLLGVLCSGCTESQKQEETETETSEVELEIWTFFDMNTPETHYQDLWDTLAEEYGYSIDVKFYSTQQIKDKLRIALACNELPDVFLVWGGRYPDYLFDAGACVPVQDYLESADFRFRDQYIQTYTDGNNYIIPCLVEAYAVNYCNTELMEEMGLTVPETWEDLVALVEQVNAYNEANGTDYAAIETGVKDSWLGELLYCMIVNRMDPYAYDRLSSGESDFSEEVYADAAEKIRELVDMGAFPDDYMETGEVEAVENFIDGEAVLFPHQSTIVFYLMENMGEDAFEMVQFPCCAKEFDADYAAYLMDINHTLTPGLCISSQTEYQDEAAELCLEFAQRVNEINVTEYGYLNMTEEDLEPASDLALPVRQFRRMIEESQKVTAYWYAELSRENGENWRNLTKKLFAGEVEVSEFIERGSDYLKFDE